MNYEAYHDVETFLNVLQPFLAPHEAENNLPYGILNSSIGKMGLDMGLVREGESIIGAWLRTPPREAVIVFGTQERALLPLLENMPAELKGVLTEKVLAEAFMKASGRPYRAVMHQRIMRLDEVIHPQGVAGALRLATQDDFALLVVWMEAFYVEALPHEAHSEDGARDLVQHYLDSPYHSLYLWEVAGEAVSMAGTARPSPHGKTVNAVYTPPQKRGNGYASACVAALSQTLLDGGYDFCCLFTDLANPISNRIYEHIGYYPVGDVDILHFEDQEL